MIGKADKKLGTLPTFINIGPGRCATSWLHEILKAHPDVAMANVKETEFFNSNYHLGLTWYLKHFDDANGLHVGGEISNCYYTEPAVAERIVNFNPKMKIMINIRDPYSLMQSFHGFGIRRGIELGPLEESLDVHIGRLMGSGYSFREKRGALNPGDEVSLMEAVHLSRLLKPFLESFPREQVYFFIYERLAKEKETVLKEIYEFLGVNSEFIPPVTNEVVNAAITPKSKWVARLATNVSYGLRRAGAYGLLTRLHKSRLVKKIFYSNSREQKSERVDPRQVLDKESRLLLDQEIESMIELVPELAKWWKHDSAMPESAQV